MMSYYRKYIGIDPELRKIWSAAVRGEITEEFGKSVTISEIRKTISKLPEPVPLQVSATLLGGISVIHQIQTHLLYEKSNIYQDKIFATMEGAKNMSNRDIASGSGPEFVDLGVRDDLEGIRSCQSEAASKEPSVLLEEPATTIIPPDPKHQSSGPEEPTTTINPPDPKHQSSGPEGHFNPKSRVEKRSQRPPGPRKHPRPPEDGRIKTASDLHRTQSERPAPGLVKTPERDQRKPVGCTAKLPDEPGEVLGDFQQSNQGTSRNGTEDDENQQAQLNDAAVHDKTADLDVTLRPVQRESQRYEGSDFTASEFGPYGDSTHEMGHYDLESRVEKRSQRPPEDGRIQTAADLHRTQSERPAPGLVKTPERDQRKHVGRTAKLPDEPGEVLGDFQQQSNQGTSRNGTEDDENQQAQLNDAAVHDKTADFDVTLRPVQRESQRYEGSDFAASEFGPYSDSTNEMAPFIPRRSARLSPVRRARAARGARNAVLLARGEKEELSTYQLIGRPPRSKRKRKHPGNINSRRTRRRSTSPAPASLAVVVPSGSQALQGSQVPVERPASSKSPGFRSASSAPQGFESASPDPQGSQAPPQVPVACPASSNLPGFRPATDQETHDAFSSQAPPQVPVACPASSNLPGFRPATYQETHDAFTSDDYMETDDESQAYVAFHTPRGNNTMHNRPIESPYDLQTAEPAVDDLALQIFYTSLESQAGIPLEETLEMHEKDEAAYMMYRVVVMESLGKIEVEKNCLGVKEVRKGPKYKA